MSESKNKPKIIKQSKDERIKAYEEQNKQIYVTLGKIQDVIAVQKRDGNWDRDQYTYGCLNGMLLIDSILDGKPYKPYEKPKRWTYERWYEKALRKIKSIFSVEVV